VSLEQFLESLTLEEIEKLRDLKLRKSKVYNFSKIRDSDLRELFEINQEFEDTIFQTWFNGSICLDSETVLFLEKLIERDRLKLKYFSEEDLKVKFLSQIFNRIDFEIPKHKIRDFYDSDLTYKTDEFELTGRCDFYISKGIKISEKPYFFIQEFKRGRDNSDPEPQLLAELISAVELNSFNSIKGAYIVGTIWNFVVLQRLSRHRYTYYISSNFDSTKIDDLKSIYRNLLYIKEEIIELVESE
jgi:hypothetical protein